MRKISISVFALLCFSLVSLAHGAESIECWFPPAWMKKPAQVKAITGSLSHYSGYTVKPRIANNYPRILRAFSSETPSLVYVGSFVQAIIRARDLGTPLVQGINGKELYAGIMIYPKDENPETILKQAGAKIAFAKGASSGESSAKAATAGQAAVVTANHAATCAAIKAGKARAGLVKDWWWESNSAKYPEFKKFLIPGISQRLNPDYVLTASKTVTAEQARILTKAAKKSLKAFKVDEMAPFSSDKLDFSLDLMRQGKIDPLTYSW